MGKCRQSLQPQSLSRKGRDHHCLAKRFQQGDLRCAYGAQYDELLGFRGVAKRSAFVIDKEGVVRYASVSDDAKVLPDFAAVKACLESLN